MPTPYTSSLTRSADEKAGERVSVLDFGADPTGVGDSTTAFANAISAIVTKGRGIELYIPGGAYDVGEWDFPATLSGLVVSGDGEATVLRRNAAIPSGKGWLDIQAGASNLTFRNLVLDGAVTSPAGFNYSSITGGDPMLAALTTNTSVWVHENATRIRMEGVTVRHTGGYAVLLDARAGLILDVRIINSLFENNRPFLFGTDNLDLHYGSWAGGVFAKGDGTTAALNVVRNFLVRGCVFRRMLGNALWSHNYGLSAMHANFQWQHNIFEDCGLDGMLLAGVAGGSVANNTLRRIGYTTVDDGSASVPKYLANHYAVGLDTAGLVKNVNYTGNSFLNCNGACMDLDGYALGTVSGNHAHVSSAGEPEYTEDAVANMGIGAGQITYGLQVSNSNNDATAGTGIHITGNTFDNLMAGAIRLFATRNSQCDGNTILHPAAAIIQPILLGNIGTTANLRSYNNVVTGNRCDYSPAGRAAIVVENNNGSAFDPADKNYVYGNVITATNSNAFEFFKDAVTASSTRVVLSSQANALGAASESLWQRENSGNTALTRLYAREDATTDLILNVLHRLSNGATVVGGPLLNVSLNGGATSGAISTGGRSTLPFEDVVATGKLFADSALILTDSTLAYPNDAKLDLLSDSYGLIRYNSTLKAVEISASVAGGHRVWSPITASSSLWTASGSDIYNSNAGKVFIGATMDDGSGLKFQVTGSVSASVGYYTPGAALNALYAPNGGLTAANATVFNAGAGASAFQIKAGSVQGATNLLQILDNSSAQLLAFTAGHALAFGSDVGLARHAAGVLEVNNGTVGALADLTGRFISLAGLTGTFNAFQVLAGGAYVPDGFTTDQAYRIKALGGVSPSSPGVGYGALGYSGTSLYYYWNGSAYATVDLAAVSSGGLWNTTASLLYPTSTAYNVAIGRTTDDGTAFKLQVAGSVSISQGLVALQTIQSTIAGSGVAFQAGGGTLQILGNGSMGLAGPILAGIASTDLSSYSIATQQSINVVSATTNASVLGMFVAGGRSGLASGRSTVSGTFLPLCLDAGGAERARFTTAGLWYINHTVDDGSGAQVQIQGNLNVVGVVQSAPGAGLAFQVNSGVIQLFGTGLINAANYNLALTGTYQINGLGAFRKSGGVLQWSNDGSTWNGFSVGGTAVTQITGTANQVLANGVLTPQTGAVTLSLPQNIHLAATPAFQGILLSMPGNLNDGSGYLAQINGGIEMTLAGGNILSKGTTANAIYASAGGVAAISGFYVGVNGATQVVNSTGVFVGPSINLTGGGSVFTADAGGNLSSAGFGFFTNYVNTNFRYRINAIDVFRFNLGLLQWSNDGASWTNFAASTSFWTESSGTLFPSNNADLVLIGRSVADGSGAWLEIAGSPSVGSINAAGVIQSVATGANLCFQANGGVVQIFGNGTMNVGGPLSVASTLSVTSTLSVGGAAAIDPSRNLVNIGTADFSGRLTIGLGGSTDTGGSIIASSSITVVTSSFNASNCGLFAAGGRSGLASGRSGAGGVQPLCFDCNFAERARFLTSGQYLVGRTLDDGFGLLQVGGAITVTSGNGSTIFASILITAGSRGTLGLADNAGRSIVLDPNLNGAGNPAISMSGNVGITGETISTSGGLRHIHGGIITL